jgi:hypothetical protein
MPKITPSKKKPGRDTSEKKIIQAKTKDSKNINDGQLTYKWWNAASENDMCFQIISTASYLQKNQQFRVKQASIFNRVVSGKPLMNYALNSKMLDISNTLPMDRPAMNVTYSCVDTLVSRMTQNRPQPVFLTDNGHYKERNLAKQMNQFITGEFFRCRAYEIGMEDLRDSCHFGDGFVKIMEKDKKVALERVLTTELWVDRNDAYYGNPRSLYQTKLVDREVAEAMFPDAFKKIDKAMKAYVDGSSESTETVSDQIIIVEAWHLPSTESSDDGMHVLACSNGLILKEEWKKQTFPFVKIAYDPNSVGWFSRGLVEILLGTQIEINKMLITASQSVNIMGVPSVWIDEMAKIVETSFNNNVGTIGKYRGTPPIFRDGTTGLGADFYDHLQRLVTYAYQQSGISALAATSQKPMGLNSGEAIRSYDALQSDRFAALSKRYEQYYIDLAYQIIDLAKDICEREGSYTTVYPNKDGTREVDLPKASILKDTYVIQCFDQSSLPRDPAGRYSMLSEMLAAGEIDVKEFRRLSGFPDLKQSDILANALEERVLQILDTIVDTGEYTSPDPFLLDPTNLASTLCAQYINLYAGVKLEEAKMQKLRDFFLQINALQQAATAPPPQPVQPQGQMPAAQPPQAPISPTSGVAV